MPLADRVLVPERRLPAVHAQPEEQLRGLRGQPEQVRLQGRPQDGSVGSGLPRAASTRATPAHLHLIGWTGDFADADNFIGTFFQDFNPQFGFRNPELFKMLDDAEVEADRQARIDMYKQANQLIMEHAARRPVRAHQAGAGLPARTSRASCRARPRTSSSTPSRSAGGASNQEYLADSRRAN